MSRRLDDDSGLGLVELIVAMFLLAVIALAILPAMLNGIRFSSEQSDVATATRQLNSLVEQARSDGTCDGLTAATQQNAFEDGIGNTFTTAAEDSDGDIVTVTCTPRSLHTFTLVARQGGKPLAHVSASVYVP